MRVHDERRLHIAFRVGRFPSRSETFVASQVAGLSDCGHSVCVLADGAEPGVDQDVRCSRARLRYLYTRYSAIESACARLPYRIRRRVEAAAERRLCLRNDVVIANFGWAGAAVAASVAGKSRRARLATIFHGDDMSRTLAHNGPHFYDQLFRESDLLLPISNFWCRRLAAMGAPETKLTVHRMGVDPDRFAFAPRRHEPQQVFELVTLGRLVEKKGTEVALRALASLRQTSREIPFRLRIFGDGPLRGPLMALRDSLGLADAVDFAGPLRHEEVRTTLAQSHAFVLPSITAQDGDMEGIPVVLMEAMASGVPVVSTWHSGIPELVEHEKTGLLARERDVEGLAAELRRLASDAGFAAALARAARQRVEQDFNLHRQNARLDTLLRRLAARASTAQPMAAVVMG